jgi:hypothetical protein
MTGEDIFYLTLELLLRQLPMLIILGIGLWFAVARRHALGRAYTWALWGFALLFANSIAGGVVRALVSIVQSSARQQPGPVQNVDLAAVSWWSLVTYLLFLGGLAAVTRAVFLDRSNAAPAA